ncbi:MAG: helix-turn-helix domain-containing protein [Arcobacteraceae bacterium]
MNRWLTPVSLELEYEFSQSTQAKMRMNKKIPYKKIGKFIRYSREEIDKWIEEHTVVAGVNNDSTKS